jgi:glycosyltransferase involved in cell wall biosynthesis
MAYGVDPDALRPDATGVAELRGQLGIPADATVLLAVGRMVYKKGFDYLLRALALLRDADPDLFAQLRVVMVGEGDLWAEWQALARDLGLAETVQWVGNVPTARMGLFNNLADIAVMPAISKPATGLAVSVLDAMSCGKPVVASRAAGNDLAVCDGVNGILTPEQDAPALARALARLAADPGLRRAMGAAGRRRIETELGWPQLAARYVAHFERLIREARP